MDSSASPDRHIAAAKLRLGHLAGLTAKTDAAERSILESAEARLAGVDADLAKLRPRVNLDQGAADSYMAAATERGQLALVIERARQVIPQ
jgi:hypothetical protein